MAIKPENMEAALTIWTVGHSTHSSEEFHRILLAHEIEILVDVRSYPGSQRYPQFNKLALSLQLESAGIRYAHNSALGGRRRALPDSRNTAWQNPSFRAYADHMESEEFEKGIKSLLELAHSGRTAVMCAESLWWRCHRSLIADYLKARGLGVIHLLTALKTESHPYTTAARIVEGRLSYEGLLSS